MFLKSTNQMNKTVVTLLIFMGSLAVNAQKESENAAIKSVIETFFKGLQNGDTITMKPTLHKEIKIQTTGTNPKGVNFLMTSKKESLLVNIAKKNPNVTYEEKLLSYDIKIDGNLASVWTPYEFYLNGKFSHCGANSFQLYNNNGAWEIIYLVDMRRRNNCKALKKNK